MGGFIVKILGLVDLFAAVLLLLAENQPFPTRIVITVAAALIMKGVIFLSDPVSKFDVIIAVYLLITLVFNVKLLSILLATYIGIKGIYSFF
jgi:hypothetical protein